MQPHRIFSHLGSGFDGYQGSNGLIGASAQGFRFELDVFIAESEVVASQEPISRVHEWTVVFSDLLEQATSVISHQQRLAINVMKDGLLPFLRSVELGVSHSLLSAQT